MSVPIVSGRQEGPDKNQGHPLSRVEQCVMLPGLIPGVQLPSSGNSPLAQLDLRHGLRTDQRKTVVRSVGLTAEARAGCEKPTGEVRSTFNEERKRRRSCGRLAARKSEGLSGDQKVLALARPSSVASLRLPRCARTWWSSLRSHGFPNDPPA